ncbi:putative adhesin [Aliiruegeria lutimaris]|uniref:Putative adhesin Stv domain-containing protein n=1 Tax=Aliiruegeria lutimaris TaxID=571298 RepID=A0A1G8P7F0_9RHOB|nr:hypothetical protein [Aliiruegeria lutimaris]SDI88441.1 hypothetical protein SAMN04488026_100892 [Aliiruegeria lutimaris]
MPVISDDGISISRTDGARQLVILSHGGWKAKGQFKTWSGDGWLTPPAGTVIHFYTVDNQFTIGNRVFTEVFADPDAAYDGTLDPGRFPHQQQIMGGQGCKDYALYIDDRPAAGNFWRNHTSQTAPDYDPDVDLATITVDGHKRHFSKVIALAAANGINYDRIHCAFCRVNR